MKKYTHLVRDKRVAELTLQFCKLYGAENCELIFYPEELNFYLEYEAPAKFNIVVDSFIIATEKLGGSI